MLFLTMCCVIHVASRLLEGLISRRSVMRHGTAFSKLFFYHLLHVKFGKQIAGGVDSKRQRDLKAIVQRNPTAAQAPTAVTEDRKSVV